MGLGSQTRCSAFGVPFSPYGCFLLGLLLEMIKDFGRKTLSYDPGEALATARNRLNGGMRNPNLFLLPRGDAHPASTEFNHLLCQGLRREFRILAFDIPSAGPSEKDGATEYCCIAIDSSQPERVRDIIKQQLWLARQQAPAPVKLEDILQGRHEKTAREFRLEEYGTFVPSRTRKFTEIRTHSFDHKPAFYRYRVALARTARLPEPMADYLHTLFTNCPNHLFSRTVFRASHVRHSGLAVEIPLTRMKHHDIIALAGQSQGFTGVSSQHENLQKFFLEHNPNTIACEVPVWMESWEFADYPRILRTRDTLTGHIDVLRCEDDGLLGVWDYKPRAVAERDADIQVFLYALMLSLRTGLPLTAFLCGYFDEKDAYLFRPSQVKLTGGSRHTGCE